MRKALAIWIVAGLLAVAGLAWWLQDTRARVPATRATPAASAATATVGAQADKIVVHKAQRTLLVYAKGQVVRRYAVALGKQPVGAKQVEGDKKTPEGLYTIHDKNPHSQYHKNLGISYPNAQDRANARRLGQTPGHSIKIHGLPNGMPDIGSAHRMADWTDGCIALSNAEVDELFGMVPVGTPIEITP